ncbi:hypothetical protein [Natronococcus occultus]|uniref:Uncharacterized protein n=1 Tax=Natronococcus occultus SP4 TaxID=694430 RepID=L0JUW4_9EURY|nr:hypothetical protein [Natronococcus occultus]AGB36787.1 hypothetical protein Natoc_0939 [Natronococcus occultus SP4]
MGTQLTEDDVGKPVETADGERVGVVASVEGATAEIDRDPDATDALRGALGQNVDDAENTVSFGEDDIGGITDGTVQLERAGDDGGAEPDAAANADDVEDVESEPVIERDESTGEESESWGEQREVGQGTEPADDLPDEEGRSGEALEPETEEMDEAGDERHPDTEEAPPHGDRTVTKDRGEKEDR